MEKLLFKNLDEIIYKDTLKSGIEVYLYPTTKTKNFYMSITVKYGAKVRDYSVDGKNKVIKYGLAHFLEHKVMESRKKQKQIGNLGLSANANTSYCRTNFNIYGSRRPDLALKILFDIFFKFKIDDKSVEREKGIILEEYNNEMNDPYSRIELQDINNILKNSYLKTSVLGTKEDISNMTKEDLMTAYDDFYTPKNIFISVTGNFDEKVIYKKIIKYINKIKFKKEKLLDIKKYVEPDNIIVPYMEIKESVSVPKVIMDFKINKNSIKVEPKIIKMLYLRIIFYSLFGGTSSLYNQYKKEGLFTKFSTYISESEDHYLCQLNAATNKPDEFIKKIKKDLKKLIIDNNTFERKKKLIVSNYISRFESIENVESIIVGDIVYYDKLYNNMYDLLCDINYEELTKIFNSIDFDNYSILKVLPK